jgi:tetraacyldisaccharide 4'-kinase
MKAPAFWNAPDALIGRVLAPLGWAYAGATAWRLKQGEAWRAPVPVICIGNLTAGGAGKTPVVRDLARRLTAAGQRPAILSRGYGGREPGPLKVDPARHDAAQVGDEPLMLACDITCWIARDRAAGARAMAADGAGLILMDDGLQNPGLRQDLKIVVVDGATGFGNRRAIPAGPLREDIAAGLARADALVIVGTDEHALARDAAGKVVLTLGTAIDPSDLPAGKVAAFAGIGRPEKFRAALAAAGAEIVSFRPFADHHPYRMDELAALEAEAAAAGSSLVTTEKDWVRLSPEWRGRIKALPLSVHWDDEAALASLLARVTGNG